MLYIVLIIMENPNNLPDLFTSLMEEGLSSRQPWTTLLQNAMRNITVPQQQPQDVPTPNPIDVSNQHINTNTDDIIPVIDNFMYEYSRNIRDYNKNVQDMIRLLQSTQRPLEPVSLFTYAYSNYPSNANANASANALTQDEITNATRTYGYTNDMITTTEDNNRCPISLETFQVGDVICEIRGCGHIFKCPPLMRWFRRNSQCPMCRYQLRDYRQPEPEPRQNEDVIETYSS